ncbi:MAG: transglutaminase family protein [Nitrosomonas sp.]|nr:transglutaminase family protein [Nitrosomonas sp.]
MNRRDFIKFIGASSLMFPMTQSIASLRLELPEWKSYRLTYQIDLPADAKNARLWLPLPDTNDTQFQFTQGSLWNGNATKAEFGTISGTNFPLFTAEWQDSGPKNVTVSSIVKTADRFVNLSNHITSSKTIIPPYVNHFLKPTKLIPTNGIVLETANKITSNTNSQDTLQQARALYDWVVDHGIHDEAVPGRGIGDVKKMLSNNQISGKCADLNSLFVGLSRALGIPARLQYGIRINESKIHDTLGKFGDISQSHHCRAEFYLRDLGWIPVDPADVCNVAQENKMPINHPTISLLREKLFGFWEMNWISFNNAEDIKLAGNSVAGQLPFFMYPHAEVGNQIQNSLQPNTFKYKIISSELISTGARF